MPIVHSIATPVDAYRMCVPKRPQLKHHPKGEARTVGRLLVLGVDLGRTVRWGQWAHEVAAEATLRATEAEGGRSSGHELMAILIF